MRQAEVVVCCRPNWAIRGADGSSYVLGLSDDQLEASEDAALKSSLNDDQGMTQTGSGLTHMSRISRAMDAANKKKGQGERSRQAFSSLLSADFSSDPRFAARSCQALRGLSPRGGAAADVSRFEGERLARDLL